MTTTAAIKLGMFEEQAREILGREGGLDLWDGFIGVQDEVTSRKHASTEVSHDWLGLQMEVAEHLVGTPSSQKAN